MTNRLSEMVSGFFDMVFAVCFLDEQQEFFGEREDAPAECNFATQNQQQADYLAGPESVRNQTKGTYSSHDPSD